MVVNSIVNGFTFIIEELGIFAVGATVIGWVARDLISQYFDKELKRHQAELEKDKMRFSELHNERARITAELYERFIEFEEDMRSLTTPIEYSNSPPKDEKLETAAESGNQFINYYMKNKIYFPPHICETVEDLNEEMKGVFDEFRIYKPYESSPYDPQDPEQWHESWKKVTEEEVPELKSELERHFRELLGVDLEN
jgi:hypothetical protein